MSYAFHESNNPNSQNNPAFASFPLATQYENIKEMMGQGIPNEQELLRMGQEANHGWALKTIKDVYSGSSINLSKIVIETNLKWTSPYFDVCPVSYTRDLSTKIVTKMNFPQHLDAPISPFAMVRTIEWHETQKEITFGGRGIGFMFESNWLKTPGANAIFQRLWRALGQATCLAAQLMVIKAMEECHEVTYLMNVVTGNPCGNIGEMLKDFNRFLFILNKSEKGFWALLDMVSALRASNDADAPTRAFGPQGIKAQLMWGSDYMTEQYRSGGNAMTRLERGSDYFRVIDGISLYEQEPIFVHNCPTVLQPFVSGLTMSWFFESNNDYLKTQDVAADKDHQTKKWRAVTRMDLSDNASMRTIGIEEIVKADQSFNAQGALRTDILTYLAENYDTLFGTTEFDMQYAKSENDNPLLDPHLSTDTEGTVAPIAFFGEQEPAFCKFDSIESAAGINTNQMVRNFGDRGQQLMQDMRAMFDILDSAANYTIPQSSTSAGHIEFSAAATALVDGNLVGGNGRTAVSIRGQTPRNPYGCDFLYPLTAERQYAVQVAGRGVVPLVFVSFDAEIGVDVNRDRISSSFFTIAGTAGQPETGGAGPLPAFVDRNSIESTLVAPEFPPGFSCLTHAAYIHSLVGSNDQVYQSWIRNNRAAQEAFQTVARGWTAYKMYWQQQKETFSPQLRSAQLTNPIMNPEACPSFMRPSGTPKDEYLSQIAYGTTAFLGFRAPLAVAVQSTRLSRTYTVASGAGVSAAIATGLHNAAWQSLYPADMGEQRNDYPSFSSGTDRELMVRGLFGPAGRNVDEALARRVIDSLFTSDALSSTVRDALRRDGGRAFAQMINQSAMDFTFANGLLPADAPNTNKLFFARQNFSERLQSRSLAELLVSNSADERAYASMFVNSLYDTFTLASSQQRFNAATFSNMARTAMDRLATYQTASQGRDSNSFGGLEQQRLAEAQRTYASELGSLPQNAANPLLYDRTTQYVITGLSTSGSTFKSTTPARAYVSAIRPTSLTDFTRAMNPYELNTNAAFNSIARDGGARLANVAALDIADPVLLALLFPVAGPGLEGFQQESAEHLRSHARAGYGDVWDDTGFGHSDQYTNDEWVPPENYDVAGQFVGDSDESHFYADIMLIGPLLPLCTRSRWMADRVTRCGQISDRFARAMALTIITSRIHRHVYEACIRKKYVLLRTYLLFCPFIDLAVGSMIFANDGAGATEYSFPDVSVGFDANTLGFHVRVSYQMGAYIVNDKNITVIPAVILKSYQGGGSCRLVAAGACKTAVASQSRAGDFAFDWTQLTRRRGDVFVFCTGSDWSVQSHELPLSGRFDSAVFRGNLTEEAVEQLAFQQYPCAAYANLCCGFNKMGVRGGRSINSSEGINELLKLTENSRLTPICFRGPQMGFNGVTGKFDDVICAGRGGFGELSIGAGGVFTGGLGLFNKGPTLTQTYGTPTVPTVN